VGRRRSIVDAAKPRSSIDVRYSSRWVRGLEHGQVVIGGPLEQGPQIVAVGLQGPAATVGQEGHRVPDRRSGSEAT
jgi:hypothetical protein